MKTKTPNEFSFPLLFAVNAVSFLLFSGFVKVINGSPNHSFLFLVVGVISLFLASVSFIYESATKEPVKKKNKLYNSDYRS